MKFRFNLMLAWAVGWMTSGLLAALILAWVSGTYSTNGLALIVAFLIIVLLPVCYCYYAGLRNQGALATIILLSSAGWFTGTIFTPQVSAHSSEWMEWISASPFVRHNWTIPCFTFSGIFAICGIILDPRTKRVTIKDSE
jgi:hypothetical protein